MQWTREHDILLCREILALEVYKHKKGTNEAGRLRDEHRRTGNFLPGGAVNHLPKKISQVAQIFTKESKRNEGHIATT